MCHAANGQTANYTWDVNSPLASVIQDTNNTYVYGLELISSTDGSGNQTYFTHDGVGSTTDLTNSSGVVTDTYKYDVFGTATHTSGTSANYWQFAGQQSDPSTSLYHVRARTLDQHPYAQNNPTNRVDPTGFATLDGQRRTWRGLSPQFKCDDGR
jgi:hypothetical protein